MLVRNAPLPLQADLVADTFSLWRRYGSEDLVDHIWFHSTNCQRHFPVGERHQSVLNRYVPRGPDGREETFPCLEGEWNRHYEKSEPISSA
jgi:hypothetical protein